MTIEYDPELPYAYVGPDGKVEARFMSEDDATYWIHDVVGGGEVIDTTPKPKIPQDAEYLIWERDGETTMAFADGGEWYGNSEYWTHEQILEEIGDAEVTVLVRKEES